MNFIGTFCISTIELMQHETFSVEIQCMLLAVALLQKLPKGSAASTVECVIEMKKLISTLRSMEADHSTKRCILSAITRGYHNRVRASIQ